jgi:hypothetical protein
MPSIVQFFHPGSEHGYDSFCQQSYYKEWNHEEHKRKYIINSGSYVENNKKHDGTLLFWCEWEPTSLVENLYQPMNTSIYDVYPKYLHFPFLPPMEKIKLFQDGGYQNTDPFIFGEKFKYSICRQDSCPGLKELEDGSLIIFGSRVNFRFVIDTVFVVKGSKPYYSALDNNIKDMGPYLDIVLKMSCKEAENKNHMIKRILYTGATFDDDFKGIYSFVPAMKYEGKKQGFPRIYMPDEFYEQKIIG